MSRYIDGYWAEIIGELFPNARDLKENWQTRKVEFRLLQSGSTELDVDQLADLKRQLKADKMTVRCSDSGSVSFRLEGVDFPRRPKAHSAGQPADIVFDD
ncbi:hypothetical protein ACFL26_01845 [Patescibacteria group bacterium]